MYVISELYTFIAKLFLLKTRCHKEKFVATGSLFMKLTVLKLIAKLSSWRLSDSTVQSTEWHGLQFISNHEHLQSEPIHLHEENVTYFVICWPIFQQALQAVAGWVSQYKDIDRLAIVLHMPGKTKLGWGPAYYAIACLQYDRYGVLSAWAVPVLFLYR